MSSQDIKSRLERPTLASALTNRLQSMHAAGVLERRPLHGSQYQWRVVQDAMRDAA